MLNLSFKLLFVILLSVLMTGCGESITEKVMLSKLCSTLNSNPIVQGIDNEINELCQDATEGSKKKKQRAKATLISYKEMFQ